MCVAQTIHLPGSIHPIRLQWRSYDNVPGLTNALFIRAELSADRLPAIMSHSSQPSSRDNRL